MSSSVGQGSADPESEKKDGNEVLPMMAVRGGPGGKIHQPIHESITLAALLSGNGGIAAGSSVDNVNQHDWEYVRGAVWNDDPDCLLFADSSNENRSYAVWDSGTWLYKYNIGESQWRDGDEDRFRNPTGRSHYGDLQFLHCMACQHGESPEETKRKIMTWLEVMYKLMRGEDGITADTITGSTKLREFQPAMSLPPRWKPLRYLLAKETPFQGVDINRRALGSILHIIQDSYAIGHTRRTLLNPQDKENDHPLRFKAGTYDQWGAIENFHTYSGQSHDHAAYDHADEKLANPQHLDDLSQFDRLIGCRMAVNKCRELVALVQSGTKWDGGAKDFFDKEILSIAPNATPANNQVW